MNYKETDVENLLSKYGQVISTRILRDQNSQSKGKCILKICKKIPVWNFLSILGYSSSNPMFPLFLQFPEKRSIYKHVSDNSKKCLSVSVISEFWLLSMVCSASAAYTSLGRGLKYSIFDFLGTLFGLGKNIDLCLKKI